MEDKPSSAGKGRGRGRAKPVASSESPVAPVSSGVSNQPSPALEPSASGTEVSSTTIGARGVAGASSSVTLGRGRGRGRGRRQPKKDAEVIVGSSSGSDVTVSPTGSLSGEVYRGSSLLQAINSNI